MLSKYFSESYVEARAKFRALTDKSGGVLNVYEHPSQNAPDGSPLSIDIAWFGPQTASKVLVALSGTHGQEAFAGSAVQQAWIDQGGADTLGPDMAVLFVHGVNPYGWAYFSRSNEDNIDLNRNFVDFAKASPGGEVDLVVQDLMKVDEVSIDAAANMFMQIPALFERFDPLEVMNAAQSGQGIDPEGINYRGQEPAWSHLTWKSIVDELLSKRDSVGLIDWHTALGPYAQPFFMCFHDPSSAAYEEACKWWGRERVDHQKGASPIDGSRPDYEGLLIAATETWFREHGVTFVGSVIEFGTFPGEDMSVASIIDRKLRFDSVPETEAQRLRAFMMDMFYPPYFHWRMSVVREGTEIIRQALKGLSEMGKA